MSTPPIEPKKKKTKSIKFDNDSTSQSNQTQLQQNDTQTKTAPPPYQSSAVTVYQQPMMDDMFFAGINFREVSRIIVCFKYMESHLSASCLNRAAYMLSRYIHCEVVISDNATYKSLFITAQSQFVHFDNRDKSYNVGWEQVSILLPTIDHRRRLRDIVRTLIVTESTRRFWAWNIYCHLCFSSPFFVQSGEPQTRTCTEITMRVLNHVFGLQLTHMDCFSYTPQEVYQCIRNLEKDRQITIVQS